MGAFGAFTHPSLPRYGIGAGIATELGVWIPAGEVVGYVHSSGVQDGYHPDVNSRLFASLNAALAGCRASQGDIVVVLPGHTENVDAVDDWSNLVAGTVVVGLGHGNLRPTFTWSVATSTALLNVANVLMSNLIFKMAGPSGSTALTVAAPMTISAAGCGLYGCDFECEIDADQGSTIAVTTTASADDLTIAGCHFYGSTDGTLVTTYLRLVGTDRFRMFNTTMYGATSSTTVGVLQMLTTAPTNVHIENCSFSNRKALSVHAATGVALATGVVKDCAFGILDDATLPGWETEGNLQFFGCRTSNLAGEESAVKTPTSA